MLSSVVCSPGRGAPSLSDQSSQTQTHHRCSVYTAGDDLSLSNVQFSMGDVYMIMHVYEIHPEFGRAVSDVVRIFRHHGVGSREVQNIFRSDCD
jgi:hypothetical protein